MLYAQNVGLAKNVVYPLNPFFSSNKVTSRKSKKLWTKDPKWNNAAYEEKKKSHYFTHPAQDTTNSHPHFNQREKNGDVRKKADPHWKQEKVKKKRNNSRKVKLKQISLVKLNQIKVKI